jgi:hypothetical protein
MTHPTFEEKLEDILDTLSLAVHDNMPSNATETGWEVVAEEERALVLEAKKDILAAHKEEVERVIGPDETLDMGGSREAVDRHNTSYDRNQLRKEQRQRAGLGE